MNRRTTTLSALMLALLLAAWSGAGAGAAAERGPLRARPAAGSAAADDASQARVIVKYRASSALMRAQSAPAAAPATTSAATSAATSRPLHAAALSRRLGLALRDGRVLGERTQGLRGSGLSSAALAARLAAQPDVEWAVPDQRRRLQALPSDPLFAASDAISPAAGQWYLRAPDATLVSAINAVGAWELSPGAASVTVAVLDTGVRFDHPDLAGKLHPGYDFVRDLETANDGGGRDADASDPGDWTAAGQCDAGDPAYDSSWHGTQVAGLIGAATDNALGMASVGRNVMLLPVRVLGKCGGFDSDILAAMRWAGGLPSLDPALPANAHPAKVINMSLGSSGSCADDKSDAYRDVFADLTAAGVSVVVAAGNDTGKAIGIPANCPGAIAVTGVRHAGTKVGYSNIGPEAAIAAPAGNCVNLSGACLYPLLTTINTGSTAPGANTYSDSGNYSVGTSFAAPIVAGTVGLMLSIDPTLTPARIKSLLQGSARAFPTSGADAEVKACRTPDGVDQLECYCTTSTCGAGLLDAAAALAAVKALLVPPVAAIAASPAAPTAGGSVTLSAAASSAAGGRTISSYQWAITEGSAIASFSGASNGASATLATSAAGSVTVSLAVTDSAGLTGSTTLTLIVAAPAVVVTPEVSGGGGGAMGLGWLAGLLLAIVALWRSPARAGRAP